MIIKHGEFVSFAPAELLTETVTRTPKRPQKPVSGSPKRVEAKRDTAPSSRSDLLQEVERLVRANERLALERDQLREELSRQSLEARRVKLSRGKPKHVNENLRRQELAPTPSANDRSVAEPVPGNEGDVPGLELARVVVNWFWEDADEASVRLVHDALTGQGIRTLIREDETEAQ